MSLPAARYDLREPTQRQRGLTAAASALKGGGLVQLDLETGAALLADAFSAAGVGRLRAARGRPDLVPQVLVAGRQMVAGIATVNAAAGDLMTAFWPGGLTLLLPSQPSLAWDVALPGGALPVRMPLSAGAIELLDRTGPLAAAPADPTGGSPVTVRVVLTAGAGGRGGVPTVVDATAEPPALLRAGEFSAEQLRVVCPALTVAGQPAT